MRYSALALILSAFAIPSAFGAQIALSDFVNPQVDTFSGYGWNMSNSSPLDTTWGTLSNFSGFRLQNFTTCHTGPCLAGNWDQETYHIALDDARTKFGMWVGNINSAPVTVTFFDSAMSSLGSVNVLGSGFAAWESAGGIQYIDVTDLDGSGYAATMDDFTMESTSGGSGQGGNVAATPEPSTFALLGSAGLGVVMLRRRRQA